MLTTLPLAIDPLTEGFISITRLFRFFEGLDTMQVLIFGAFDENHLRFVNMKKAIESQGFSIKVWNIRCNRWLQIVRFLKHSAKLVHDAISSSYILVPYPGWRSLYLAKVLSVISGRKLVFDAFFSNYNTYVEDRKYIKFNSVQAISHLVNDRVSCKLADIVLLDTNQHIDYFTKLLSIDREKFIRFFVGTDIEQHKITETNRSDSDPLTLFFVGTFIPLQGTKFIIKAVHLLFQEGYKFRFIMVGKGQESNMIDRLITKLNLEPIVERIAFVPYPQLLELINKVDICLGIFGLGEKAKNVIATKIFDYAGMNKVFISGKSEAMAELFEEGADYIGCMFGNSRDLADKIGMTINNFSNLKKTLNPLQTILKKASIEKLGINLMEDLKKKSII